MKSTIIFITISICISCKPKIQSANDLIQANLTETSKGRSWSKIKTFTVDFEVKRFIGDSLLGEQRKKVFNKFPMHQKEEGYKGAKIESINIANKDGGLMVRFENGSFAGSTKIPGKTIYPNPVIALVDKRDKLEMKDSLWNDKAVFVLKDMESGHDYIFDGDNFLLIAKSEPSYYGRAVRKYRDYRWIDGYFLPFTEDYFIENGGYRSLAIYSSYDINPAYDSTLFQIRPEWISLAKGDDIPEFELPRLDSPGNTIKNQDISGKVVLIDFWATWCKPCIAEFPFMRKAYEQYKEKGFEILSVSLDTDDKMLDRFVENKGFPWMSTHPQGGFKSEVARRFQIVSLPKPILVDEKGTILATDLEARGENLEKLLRTHLEE